ncbi:MAG: DUF4293 domain-containing protein [Flavobacteriaceae bacterium]
MIQRIQSVYLLLVAILSMGIIFAFELWTTSGVKVFASDLLSSDSILNKLVPVLFVLSGLVALYAIFQFKNRKLQFVLGRLVILINLFLLGILIYLSLNLPGEGTEVTSEKGIGMFIPTVVILVSVLATKAIKKDEDLVKSVDRLR